MTSKSYITCYSPSIYLCSHKVHNLSQYSFSMLLAIVLFLCKIYGCSASFWLEIDGDLCYNVSLNMAPIESFP